MSLFALAQRIMRRPADVLIGGSERPYLERWFVIPRNPLFNVYLHRFWRSDDDRALHDHPWWNVSLILRGSYTEHTIEAGGIHRRRDRRAGAMALRAARAAHRIEIDPSHAGQVITLFLTGPRLRVWGFHCPVAGWVDWRDFTSDDGLTVGRGCGD